MSVQQKEATVVITPNIEKAFIFVGGQESKDLYDSRIVEAERERIIKLLEKSVDVYLADKLLFEAAIISNAIANIKGETIE